MIECPKCGFKQPPGLECSACGIVFAKFAEATQGHHPAAESKPTWEGAWFPDEEVPRPRPSWVRLATLVFVFSLTSLGGYFELARHTEAFEVASNTVLGFEEVRLDLGADRGDEMRIGYLFRGQARVSGQGGQGRYLFRVFGPVGEGTALVHLIRNRGTWRAVQVDFKGPWGRVRSLEVGASLRQRRQQRQEDGPTSSASTRPGGSEEAL